MSTTLTRPAVRQPYYYRRLAGRTVQWTAVVTTGVVACMYVTELLGHNRAVAVAAALLGVAVGGLAYQSVIDRRAWAHGPLALLWVWWIASGYYRHGMHSVALLASALFAVALSVAAVLALLGIWKRPGR